VSGGLASVMKALVGSWPSRHGVRIAAAPEGP
jgi:hypothetical protein